MPHKLLLLVLISSPVFARQAAQGFCQRGGQTVVTSGVSGAPKVQASYPQCTVSVFITGTSNLATIYSDNSSTPLANPFTATNLGFWKFYSDNGRYDVTISGGGLPAPFTFPDILLADPQSGPAFLGYPVTVPQGGTGATSLTGILQGNGVAPVTANIAALELQYLRRKPNNGATTAYEFATLPSVSSADYIFPAQTPGGSLSIGSNTIAMSPCPLGVAGTSSDHDLYISGGVGTADQVRITGGTCTSGATSGTVIVTAAFTHSGAWTVQSATAGIKEAVNVATNFGTTRGAVTVPAGVFTIYAPVTYRGFGLTISGAGIESTAVTQMTTSASHFNFPVAGHYNQVLDMQLFGSGKTGGWGIEFYSQFGFRASGLLISGAANAIKAYDSSQTYISNSDIRSVLPAGGIGILIDGATAGGAETSITNVILANFPPQVGETSIGLEIRAGGGINLRGVTQVGHGIGMQVVPASGQLAIWGFVTGCNFDSNNTHGIVFAPSGAGVAKGWMFVNTWSSSNSLFGWYMDSAGGTIQGIHVSGGSRAYNNGRDGVVIAGASTTYVSLADFYACGNSASPSNTYNGITVNSASHISILGGASGACDSFTSAQQYGVQFLGGADNLVLGNIDLQNNSTGGVNDQATGLFKVIDNRLIPQAERYQNVASAASFTLPATDAETVIVTGATALTTMAPAWNGRRVRLIFTDVSPGGVNTGGGGSFSFASVVSVTTNKWIDCEYLGASWYCK